MILVWNEWNAMHEKSRDMILVWNEWKAMDEESGIWTRLENEER